MYLEWVTSKDDVIKYVCEKMYKNFNNKVNEEEIENKILDKEEYLWESSRPITNNNKASMSTTNNNNMEGDTATTNSVSTSPLPTNHLQIHSKLMHLSMLFLFYVTWPFLYLKKKSTITWNHQSL